MNGTAARSPLGPSTGVTLARRIVDDAVYVEVGDNPRTLRAHDNGPSLDQLHAIVLDDEPSALRLGRPNSRLKVSRPERGKPAAHGVWRDERCVGVVPIR